jgi:hypothetical protein
MYIKAVAACVMLYLQHDLFNIIFKIKEITYSLRITPTAPYQGKILGAHLLQYRLFKLNHIDHITV